VEILFVNCSFYGKSAMFLYVFFVIA